MFTRNETFQDSLQPVVSTNVSTDSIVLFDSTAAASANTQTSKPKVEAKVEEPEILPNFFFTTYTKDFRPRLRKTDAEAWILPLLLVAFFLAAIVNTLFPKTIRNILMNFLKRDAFRKIREEDNLLYRRTLALMLLIFLVVSPVFIYQVAGHFNLSTVFLPFMPAYWQLFLIGAGILGLKLFTIQVLGYLFNCTVEAGQYITGIILMNCFLGVLFIPVSLGIKISATEISGYLLMGGIGLFVLFYLISLLIGIGAGIRSEALSKFHLILYFCTLEILPVFLIIKNSAKHFIKVQPMSSEKNPQTEENTGVNSREQKVKTILVTQPKPETDKSPYFDLAKKMNVKIDFRSFIHVEGISAKEFRKEKINILEHSAVILTSRNAVDNFFRLCTEMRVVVPESMKYFCISESTAFYLQKYVQYRKRKIFYGNQKFIELMDVIKKNKTEKFLLLCSDIHKDEIPEILDEQKINYTKAVIYRTVCSDLSDLSDVKYDMLVFFSPSGIKSLFQNFPDFKQNNTRIAAFGPTTAAAVREAELILDIHAPQPQAPSMTMAIEQYLKLVNKGR